MKIIKNIQKKISIHQYISLSILYMWKIPEKLQEPCRLKKTLNKTR